MSASVRPGSAATVEILPTASSAVMLAAFQTATVDPAAPAELVDLIVVFVRQLPRVWLPDLRPARCNAIP
eukprot:CAMPEP_0172897554 /NCGR_PEP_ID=MMETSP1075-20121228/157815_1 /TAXON_ID=2916 /ORGANISM="Ceratium fusus, Strain PA161109" /LENGTH=69 /DNA_ID=CAMNT_0013753157 /DNA_START=89 /DNA_END=295 /DNA_ORIENTATION=+